jgi:hypothetical protein
LTDVALAVSAAGFASEPPPPRVSATTIPTTTSAAPNPLAARTSSRDRFRIPVAVPAPIPVAVPVIDCTIGEFVCAPGPVISPGELLGPDAGGWLITYVPPPPGHDPGAGAPGHDPDAGGPGGTAGGALCGAEPGHDPDDAGGPDRGPDEGPVCATAGRQTFVAICVSETSGGAASGNDVRVPLGANGASADASSATDANRRAGSFSRQRRIARSSPGGMSGRRVDGGGGGSLCTETKTAVGLSPRNGSCPVTRL